MSPLNMFVIRVGKNVPRIDIFGDLDTKSSVFVCVLLDFERFSRVFCSRNVVLWRFEAFCQHSSHAAASVSMSPVGTYTFPTHNPVSLRAILDLGSSHVVENARVADLFLGTLELATHNRSREQNRMACYVQKTFGKLVRNFHRNRCIGNTFIRGVKLDS